MRIALFCLFLIAFAGWAAPASAQSDADKQREQRQALLEKHKGDFDYLLGDWEFTASNGDYGKFRGYWSATRLSGGQIMDEYRVVGDKDETYYVTTTIRAYNAGLDRWELIGMDGGGGLQDFGTGQRDGGEVRIEQRFGVSGPHPSFWKIRYRNIRPDAFSWSADRSLDDGRTWTKNYQTLEARRIGPARTLPALTSPGRKSAGAEAPNEQRPSP
ncbi:hypothetical protein M2650_12530 [Luteimonas sp. SX5]|uniref:DUF1579 domain-containing protein n=1 Tax=Luteimonas galliterrae TaxID=2940486 RepID=A0ABT0MKP3_9GAMM|nr:hypothetical protein [Luteimonas galliterrae]MCL1635448.1 hypothetical protein [Luteimonas galliterrae]